MFISSICTCTFIFCLFTFVLKLFKNWFFNSVFATWQYLNINISAFAIFYLQCFANWMVQKGWKLKRKTILNVKRVHKINKTSSQIRKCSKYFCLTYVLFKNHKKTGVQCTHPKTRCPVYSNSFTPKLKNALCYFLEIS